MRPPSHNATRPIEYLIDSIVVVAGHSRIAQPCAQDSGHCANGSSHNGPVDRYNWCVPQPNPEAALPTAPKAVGTLTPPERGQLHQS